MLLEGLEVAFIAVSFGVTAQALPTAILGAAAAFLVVAGAGLLAHGSCSVSPAVPCSYWWERC